MGQGFFHTVELPFRLADLHQLLKRIVDVVASCCICCLYLFMDPEDRGCRPT